MKTLTTALIGMKNGLQGLGTWIWLVAMNRDSATIDRWALDTKDVVFDSQTYTHKNMSTEPPASDLAGITPSFIISLGDADKTLVSRLIAGKYRGQRVVMGLVNRDALGAAANEITIRGKVKSADAEEGAVSFHCGPLNPRDTTIPRDSLYRTTCRWEFKGKCGECGYAGGQTTCDKRFETCRDTMANQTRFGGCPGLPTEIR
ncbi:MAG: phage BR0599 family protein [bacterium]